MNKLPPRFYVALLIALIAFVNLFLAWGLLRAKLELGGSAPGEGSAGAVAFIEQRAMQQYCTGVVATPQGTWLVGRVDDANPTSYTQQLDKPPLAIESLLGSDYQANGSSGSSGFAGNTLFGMMADTYDRSSATFVSRLDSDGKFQVVATVGEDACLLANPDGTSVFLLTGLKRPTGNPARYPVEQPDQRAIFRSDDQGASWRWLREGLFPQAEDTGWNLKPSFFGTAMWVWSDHSNDPSLTTAGDTGVLYHSPDLGEHVEAIDTPAALAVTRGYAISRQPADSAAAELGYRDTRRFVVQTAPDRVFVWISQRFPYYRPEGRYVEGAVTTTASVELHLQNGHWRAGALRRDDGLFIEEVQQSSDGHIYAVFDAGDTPAQRVAEFDPANRSWHINGSLPNPFLPLPSERRIRDFLVGRKALVVSIMADFEAPVWLNPWREEPARVSADAAYYSTDGGRSWKKLDLPGYLGIMGIDPANDRLFGAHGNWYESSDQTVRSFRLAD
jgi:hypothetical protein